MYGLQQPRRGCAVDAGRKLRAMRVGGRVEEAAQAGINAAALGGPVEIAEDLRAAARTIRGRHVATGVRAMVVPGSQQVKAQAEREGLDRVFSEAGFEWRNAGCSMCLGMNPDVLQSGERCASTSNRNFEGRQGRGGRTHLMSPPMAAAAAVAGRIVDVRRWGAAP